MHQVLAEVPNANLATMVVWVEMLPEDRVANVETLAGEMADLRIHWFHDPKRRASRAVATSLGATGKFAWDVYLFFEADAEWKNKPPKSPHWVHQLDDSWADPTRHSFGDRLELELRKLLNGVLGQ